MTLTKRASDFLLKSEREESQMTDSEIREIFNYNNVPVFQPLIEFQQKFGGFVFYAGLEPIRFSLVKGQGGYPKSSKTAIVEFEEIRCRRAVDGFKYDEPEHGKCCTDSYE